MPILPNPGLVAGQVLVRAHGQMVVIWRKSWMLMILIELTL